jgi:exopolysaccharide production protein ExoZ
MDDRSHGKIDVIQGMRGLAALLVVMWHGSRYFGPYGTGWAGRVFGPGASLGVGLFFLISGFIMVVTTKTCDGSLVYAIRFMIKRFARVWPTYFIATLLFVILIPSRLALFRAADGPWRLLQGLSFIPAARTPTEAPIFAFPPLPVGWTLNYEMYFYAFFAVSLAFGRARWVAFATWIFISLVVVPHFMGSGTGLSLLPSTSYGLQGYIGLIVNPIILLFATGCLIGVIYQSRLIIRNTFALNMAMLVAIVMVVVQYGTGIRVELSISQWGLTLIPLLLILSIASKTIPVSPPFVTYLGGISFSLYLFHPLVQEGFDYLALQAGLRAPTGLSAFFITTAASIAVAILSRRYLELRLSDAVRDLLMRVTQIGWADKHLVIRGQSVE